ncbi:hypothetical protein F5144DRAFT_609325 [Chaetomium tenue]|uniref:Uncharacterized protein n=1 Tax=Chaetomium tenue TaxID=1854479 RepID=A0ACB7PET3_9PEZI|nr:hypothetical protein F5144DRAFT_609325 [Chaetomium globosum]
MSGTRGHSNVGIYESQDQRHYTQEEVDEMTRHTGENVKGFMPKGQTEELNRLQTEEVSLALPTLLFYTLCVARIIANCCFCLQIHRKQAENLKKDPTLAATLHGNAPAKGAIIDKELQEEDEAALRRKSDSLPGKKY